MPAWSRTLLLLPLACTAEDEAADPSPDDDSPSETDDTPPEVGGFSLKGVVHDVYTWTQTGGGLCLSASDATPIALGNELEPSVTTVVDDDGNWLLEGVPVGGTTGIILLLDDCGEDDDTFPTATLLLPHIWAGKGPEDTISGLEAFRLSTSRAETWEAQLDESGNTYPLTEYGAFMGHIETLDGDSMEAAWVRGSESSRLFYDQGDGTWGSWSSGGTTLDGFSRFAIPDAPWGNYIAQGLATDYIPLITGGLPGVVLYHRWIAQVSNYGETEE